MKYEAMLREMFNGIDLAVEDLLLLESFQIAYLPDRVPQREFAAVLWANPLIKNFLITKHPPIKDFIDDILSRFTPATNQGELFKFSDRLVWEIADLFVYVKYPEIYDKRANVDLDLDKAMPEISLENKIVIDAGAGTGFIAFEAAKVANMVFAVEPATSLRQYIREKAISTNTKNLYSIDGFLHAIPLPDGFADVLITMRAIGWQLEDELKEIERVVKKGGYVVHLGASSEDGNTSLHNSLTSSKWSYRCIKYKDKDGSKVGYIKQI